MPEAFTYSYSPEPPKKSAVIKQSCGIGDTDGFPAFDVDSDAYATKDDSKWGFLITGGAEFHMPLTVFQVTPGGIADKSGIRVADIILQINEEDSTKLTLAQAHEKIEASGKKVHFLVKSTMNDEEIDDYGGSGEEKFIVLRVPKKEAPPPEFNPTPLLGSRCWHPIMWQEPPAPPKPKNKKTKIELDEEGNEVVIELSEDESSEEEEERKLSEIAEIPKILSSTLATVSETFEKLIPAEMCEKWRKYSYDEDAHDYELSDGNEDDSHAGDKEGIFTPSLKSSSSAGSDYNSEANYDGNEFSELENDDTEDNDNDDDDEDYITEIEKLSLDVEDDDEDIGETVEQEITLALPPAEDFLTTSFTWNLRKAPTPTICAEDDDVEAKNMKNLPNVKPPLAEEKPEKCEKFERAWPWADREKIIYKQSTCHLVPRKPLGLVEKRIQLLAKQQLATKLEQVHTAK